MFTISRFSLLLPSLKLKGKGKEREGNGGEGKEFTSKSSHIWVNRFQRNKASTFLFFSLFKNVSFFPFPSLKNKQHNFLAFFLFASSKGKLENMVQNKT